jgi:hypothetical protein
MGVGIVIDVASSFAREIDEGAAKGRSLPDQLGRGAIRSLITAPLGAAGSFAGTWAGAGAGGVVTDNPAGAVVGAFVGSWAGAIFAAKVGDNIADGILNP